ncbi:MAG TPA: transposase [Thermodesulfobacteriota bacterium]|nr:transposase [Thermodesulfobacteriota bacterium]
MRHRRSIRLKDYDYSQEGVYFATICIQNRQCLLGYVQDGTMFLSHAGEMVKSVWMDLPNRFDHILLVEFVVMPNHIHGIIIIHRRGESCIRPNSSMGDQKDRPYGTEPDSIGRIIQAFKSITTNKHIWGVREKKWPAFPNRLWQRNYYEHIVRNEKELHNLREYVANNPTNWAEDEENPDK